MDYNTMIQEVAKRKLRIEQITALLNGSIADAVTAQVDAILQELDIAKDLPSFAEELISNVSEITKYIEYIFPQMNKELGEINEDYIKEVQESLREELDVLAKENSAAKDLFSSAVTTEVMNQNIDAAVEKIKAGSPLDMHIVIDSELEECFETLDSVRAYFVLAKQNEVKVPQNIRHQHINRLEHTCAFFAGIFGGCLFTELNFTPRSTFGFGLGYASLGVLASSISKADYKPAVVLTILAATASYFDSTLLPEIVGAAVLGFVCASLHKISESYFATFVTGISFVNSANMQQAR